MSILLLDQIYKQIKRDYYNKICKITQPLRDLFSAPYVSYQKVYLDGRFVLLGDHLDFLEYYLSKKIYLDDPFLSTPLNYREGKNIFLINSLIPTFGEATQSALSEMENKFGFYHNFLILMKYFDYYEILFFSSSAKDINVINLFFNKQELIYKYLLYFKKNLKKELNDIFDLNVNIANIRGITYKEDNFIKQSNYEKQIDRFLKCISPEEHLLKEIIKTLTHREREVLHWMMQGKTALETANIMGISKRTIEGFRERCRIKFGTNYTFSNLIYKIGKYQLFPDLEL